MLQAQPTGALSAQAPVFTSTLPQVALPEGQFHDWCGTSDSFLMRAGDELRLHAASGEAPITVGKIPPSAQGLRCDDKAERVVYSIGTRDALEVVSIDLKTQKATSLFKARATAAVPLVSPSPDGRVIAYRADHVDGTTLSKAADVRLIPVNGDGVRWKGDSSAALVLTNRQTTPQTTRQTYSESMEILFPETGKTISASLPTGYTLIDPGRYAAILDGGSDILLALRFVDSDQPDHTVFRCRLLPFKCQRTISKATGISMNERGDVAIAEYKTASARSNDKSVAAQPLVKALRSNAHSIVVAGFIEAASAGVRPTISPSGNSIAISWFGRGTTCARPPGVNGCPAGARFDLRNALR